MLPCPALLDTPCLLLDLDLLEANLRLMQATATHAGKHLRPHAKTHKCSALARQQLAAGAIGVCVAKLSEAERLVQAGITAILITGPVVSAAKLARVVALRRAAPGLLLAVDHPTTVDHLATLLPAAGLTLDVLLDVDVGLQRSGVPPVQALALAEAILAQPCLRLRGVQAYAGQVQHLRDYAERQQASRTCLEQVLPLWQALQARVPTCSIFSAAGTGTYDIDLMLPAVTELQVGSYIGLDAEYRAIGSVAHADCFTAFAPAVRVLASVVSAQHPGFVTVDAGLKALYRDGGVPQVLAPAQAGLVYDWFGDEYGRLSYPAGQPAPALGSLVELLPAHLDPTINLFDQFHLVRGATVVGTWPIDLRGCSQ